MRIRFKWNISFLSKTVPFSYLGVFWRINYFFDFKNFGFVTIFTFIFICIIFKLQKLQNEKNNDGKILKLTKLRKLFAYLLFVASKKIYIRSWRIPLTIFSLLPVTNNKKVVSTFFLGNIISHQFHIFVFLKISGTDQIKMHRNFKNK